MNIIAAILAGAAATNNNNVTVFSQVGNTHTLEYGIPIFLAMVFAAALFSSKSKVPHTMILLGFGISISLLSLAGVQKLPIVLAHMVLMRLNPIRRSAKSVN